MLFDQRCQCVDPGFEGPANRHRVAIPQHPDTRVANTGIPEPADTDRQGRNDKHRQQQTIDIVDAVQ